MVKRSAREKGKERVVFFLAPIRASSTMSQHLVLCQAHGGCSLHRHSVEEWMDGLIDG